MQEASDPRGGKSDLERVLTIALPHLCQFECQLTGYAVKDMDANSSNCGFLSPLMPASPSNMECENMSSIAKWKSICHVRLSYSSTYKCADNYCAATTSNTVISPECKCNFFCYLFFGAHTSEVESGDPCLQKGAHLSETEATIPTSPLTQRCSKHVWQSIDRLRSHVQH